MSDFEFLPVAAENWSDLAEFFRVNGNPNYCWCMRWRLSSMGALAVFEKVGFEEAGTGKNGRKIVRLNMHES